MNNPVAFNLFGIDVRWYGIFITCGIIAAFILSYFNARKRNINFDIVIDGFLWCFPMAIVGARLYYVAFEYKSYHSFFQIINIRNGGLAIHGGLIGGILTAYIFTKVKKVNFFEIIDVVMPGVILAQAIGRWGNFMNGEAHGGIVSEEFISKFPKFIQNGMYINGNYYNPTFLYESCWNVIVCVLLMIILYKKINNGVVLGSYMVLYSLGRFFIEGLRTDSLMFFGLRIAQIVSLTGIIAGLLIIFLAKRKRSK